MCASVVVCKMNKGCHLRILTSLRVTLLVGLLVLIRFKISVSMRNWMRIKPVCEYSEVFRIFLSTYYNYFVLDGTPG